MRTLVVPDVHHDLPWVGRIMEREYASVDRAVFLGDYFDAHRPECSAKRVCHTLAALHRGGPGGDGPECIFLVGNHDLPYLALSRTHRHRPSAIPREPWAAPFGCSGFSKSRAQDFIRYADPGWAASLRLVHFEQGWLLSHAGVPAPMLPPVHSSADEEGVRGALDAAAAAALHSAHIDRDRPWFWCGPDRGGSDPYSGPLWQDWGRSFRDDLPWPQAVGHTSSREGARQRGRSWCLDGAQTTYAVIEDGALEVRRA